MAETEGFEPSVRFPVRRFSKALVSATHPRLRAWRKRGYSEASGADQLLLTIGSHSPGRVADSLRRTVHCRDRTSLFMVGMRGLPGGMK